MRHLITPIILTILTTTFGASADQPQPVRPYEQSLDFKPINPIDQHVLAQLRAHDITPAALCSDQVFARRVCLDLIGTLPNADELRSFYADRDPDKRSRAIEYLLQRDEFADYWALKWCDALRVKSEFPINLWPNAVQAYHHWVRDALKNNQPYDEFARALLTSTGSNFRVPPVNFYRAVQGQKPETLARAVALTFMGTRLENWPAQRQADFARFFSRIAFKGTAEWKEEIIFLDPSANQPLNATFPDGTPAVIFPNEDPRKHFADWLIRDDNPWFARQVVNRIWAWIFGRGIIHEPDDIHADNPPSNPALLAYLESELIKSNYDLRHIYRLILNSRTYQQSCIARSDHPDVQKLFAVYPVRRLDAEVLVDALNTICGSSEDYVSAIPEPFTHIPDEQRTIALADGSISSPFLELFGRPSRDTGLFTERDNRPTDRQRLHLLNSTHVQKKIERSWQLRRIARRARGDPYYAVRELYLTILSRYPTPAEQKAAEEYIAYPGHHWREGVQDVAWALINSKEFLYRH